MSVRYRDVHVEPSLQKNEQSEKVLLFKIRAIDAYQPWITYWWQKGKVYFEAKCSIIGGELVVWKFPNDCPKELRKKVKSRFPYKRILEVSEELTK